MIGWHRQRWSVVRFPEGGETATVVGMYQPAHRKFEVEDAAALLGSR